MKFRPIWTRIDYVRLPIENLIYRYLGIRFCIQPAATYVENSDFQDDPCICREPPFLVVKLKAYCADNNFEY